MYYIMDILNLENTDTIILETINNFLKRGQVGLKKYGKTMDRDDLTITEWIDNAIQEQMDNILYLTKLKKELLKNK